MTSKLFQLEEIIASHREAAPSSFNQDSHRRLMDTQSIMIDDLEDRAQEVKELDPR